VIKPAIMNKVREAIRSLEGQGVDLSTASHASIVPLLDDARLAAMVLSVFRGYTTDEDVQWHFVRR
jgi:hypothetical protein